MTCREKLKMEHPEDIDPDRWGGCKGCPHHHGYMPRPRYCSYKTSGLQIIDMEAKIKLCEVCWDREILEPQKEPESTEQKPRISNMLDLLWFVEKVMANGDKSVSLYIRNDDMQITVYPYPEQEEETNE